MANYVNEFFSTQIQAKIYDEIKWLGLIKSADAYLDGKGKTLRIPNFTSSFTIGTGSTFSKSESDITDMGGSFEDLSVSLTKYYVEAFGIEDFDRATSNLDEWDFYTKEATAQLANAIQANLLNSLAKGVQAGKTLSTTGSAGVLNSANSAANKKVITYTDLVKIGQKMSLDKCPKSDRYLILDPVMISELLLDANINKLADFGKNVAETGVIMTVSGINIIEATTPVAGTAGILDYDISDDSYTLDSASLRTGIAFSPSMLLQAAGATNLYSDFNINKQSDVMSMSQWIHAFNPRTDKKGVYVIKQG